MIQTSEEIQLSQEYFDHDPYPGQPKILFIGIPYSSHTLNWINLLQGERLNIRIFSVGDGYPPNDWLFKTYLTTQHLPRNLDTAFRACLYLSPEEWDLYNKTILEWHWYLEELILYIQNNKIINNTFEFQIVEFNTCALQMKNQDNEMINGVTYDEDTQIHSCEKEFIKFKQEWKEYEINKVRYLEYNHKVKLNELIKKILPFISSFNQPKLFSKLISHPPYPPKYFPLRKKANSEIDWLINIINSWKPDIIHTLGFTPAADFYYDSIIKSNSIPKAKWVLQARGSPDLSIHQYIPEKRERDQVFLKNCHVLIADNYQNYTIAKELGLSPQKMAPFGIVPGSGGVDVDSIRSQWSTPPSKRKRIIYCPKFYNSPYNKLSSVIEAIKLAYEVIAPVEIYVSPETSDDIKIWFSTFPKEFQNSFRWLGNISRQEVIKIMMQARVMLAPSLTDGIPNVYYEAAACGAFPILSPIESITQLISAEKHSLFARNLYPNEIAEAIIRAMNDDTLVDSAVANNLSIVYEYADSKKIRGKIVNFYRSLV